MTKPRRKPKKPGPAPLADKRDQYLRLMAQGMSNSAACREVGINRRTGTRWRYGRKEVDRAVSATAVRVAGSSAPSGCGSTAGGVRSGQAWPPVCWQPGDVVVTPTCRG
jgi:hypothetical protein